MGSFVAVRSTVLSTVVVSDDPVAVDYHGWQMIDQLRASHAMPPVDPYPHFIDYAADVYGLGTNDPGQMEIIELDLLEPGDVFSDGFEDGTTSSWTVTVPATWNTPVPGFGRLPASSFHWCHARETSV